VQAEAVREAAARWSAAGAAELNATTALDVTLLTPQHFALPAVAAALQDYLAVRAQRHAQLRAHLGTGSEALARTASSYASTEQDISAAMRSIAEPGSSSRRRST
jgi:hypothetical protein